MSEDFIKRSDAIKVVESMSYGAFEIEGDKEWLINLIENIPSAELYKEFAEWVKLWFKDEPSNPNDITYINALENRIKELETDRPQGRNLSEEYPSLFECSVCGASCFDTVPWDCDINYCPNCGARMEGADDE